VLLLIVASTVAAAILLSVVGLAISELIHPDVDTSSAAGAVSGVISTLVGLLAGFLAGRQNRAQP
jgi:hypothetical protein